MGGSAAIKVLAAVIGSCAIATGTAAAQVPLPPLPPPPGQPPDPIGGRPDPQPQPQPQPPGPVSPAPGSVTEGVDVAQSGFLPSDELVPPLERAWTVAGKPVTLLAAEGRVYAAGQRLQAFDQRDGHLLWSTEALAQTEGAAYDAGAVFVSTFEDIQAYRADTGALIWRRHLTDVGFAGAPVASGGAVYVGFNGGGTTMIAFDERDGRVIWGHGTVGGFRAPALDGRRVYVAGVCAGAEAIDRATGAKVWVRSTGCSGGTGVTPALFSGNLWVPERDAAAGTPGSDLPPVLSASSGELLHRFGGARPVFVDGLSVNATDQYTQAVHDDSRELAWLVWKPLTNLIAVGHDVYGVHEDVHLNRAIVALDSETGKSLWAAPLPRLSADDRRPIVAVAPGLLLVATAGKIVAFRSALRPARGGVALGAGAFDVIAGRPFGLIGVLGADLRGPRPDVALEAAGWRAGGFRRVGSLRPDRDGGFAGGLTTRRNARFRASAGGATSNVVTVYAYPHFKLGPFRPLGRTRAQTTATVSAEGARFGGHSLVLYLQRHGSPRLVRLGAGSLRAPHRGRARATIGFLPPRHASSRDLVFVCVTRQLRLGLGRPSPLTRRCGARVLARP